MLIHWILVYWRQFISTPFVSLGLCPEFASSLLIPLNAGYHKSVKPAARGADQRECEASEMKTVNRVLSPDEVLDFVINQAELFNQLPPASVRATKRLLRSGWKKVTEKVIADEASSFGQMLRSAEAKEAFTAFFERRKPEFEVCLIRIEPDDAVTSRCEPRKFESTHRQQPAGGSVRGRPVAKGWRWR